VGFDPKPSVAPSCETIVETMADLRELLEAEGILASS
jgi:phosphoserine phosphatase